MEDIRKTTRVMLDDTIRKTIEELKELDKGSEEYRAAGDLLAKIYKLKIEEKQADSEIQTRLNEERLKNEQLKGDKIDRWIKVALSLASLGVPLMFAKDMFMTGLKTETTGTILYNTNKSLVNWFWRLIQR